MSYGASLDGGTMPSAAGRPTCSHTARSNGRSSPACSASFERSRVDWPSRTIWLTPAPVSPPKPRRKYRTILSTPTVARPSFTWRRHSPCATPHPSPANRVLLELVYEGNVVCVIDSLELLTARFSTSRIRSEFLASPAPSRRASRSSLPSDPPHRRRCRRRHEYQVVCREPSI